MKRILLAICMMAVSVVSSYGQSIRASFTFAWLSDVHLNSFAYAEDDLRQAIEDINANPAVDFTILSGDVTEFGDTKEFLLLQEILKDFRKPYLLLPGNHDVNWSENGCTMFNKNFQSIPFLPRLAGSTLHRLWCRPKPAHGTSAHPARGNTLAGLHCTHDPSGATSHLRQPLPAEPRPEQLVRGDGHPQDAQRTGCTCRTLAHQPQL